jgi:hypothetical protein
VTEAAAAQAVDLVQPPGAAPRPRSLEGLFIATLALFGFRLGARPVNDNSTLAHLRTGLDMVHGHGIPRHDPYSFTALGHRWVVQSWLPEWTYGWAWRLGGGHALVLEQAVLTALLAGLTASLARAGTGIRTGVAATIAVWIGAAYWTPRPLLFGLLFLGLTVLVVERRRSGWWLIPVVWLWVNSHGSFPLGLLWLGAVVLGETIDRKAFAKAELRYLGFFVVGLAASVLNPLGPRLLLFPLTVGDKQDVFKRIVEWRSPDFQSASGLFTLVGLGIAMLILVRRGTRWRYALPVVGFVALGLYAVRNLSAAAIVLAPVLGAALRAPATASAVGDGRGSAQRAPTRPVDRMFAAALALGFLAVALAVTRSPGLQLRAYPLAAVDWIEGHGLRAAPHRVAEQDTVGDYLIWRDGTRSRVFIDDRYDMYPLPVARDSITLVDATPGALDVLDCRGIDVVLWDGRAALSELLVGTGQWRLAYPSTPWAVYVRTAPVRQGPGGRPTRRDGSACPIGT